MKNLFKLKKGEGISGIILILICIILVIIILPAFRQFQNDNSTSISNINTSSKSVVTKGLAAGQSAPSYSGNNSAW